MCFKQVDTLNFTKDPLRSSSEAASRGAETQEIEQQILTEATQEKSDEIQVSKVVQRKKFIMGVFFF